MPERPLLHGHSSSRSRDWKDWLICEESGRHAEQGRCPVHGGDGCLILVAWIGKPPPGRAMDAQKCPKCGALYGTTLRCDGHAEPGDPTHEPVDTIPVRVAETP